MEPQYDPLQDPGVLALEEASEQDREDVESRLLVQTDNRPRDEFGETTVEDPS